MVKDNGFPFNQFSCLDARALWQRFATIDYGQCILYTWDVLELTVHSAAVTGITNITAGNPIVWDFYVYWKWGQ